LWDSSGLLAQTTALGTILHGLMGYDSQPAGMQVLVYVLVLLTIASGMRWVAKRSQPART
jgi:high-affinity iron transporter